MRHSYFLRQAFSTLLNDIARGLFIVTHSGLATVGLVAAASVLTLWLKPEWLSASQSHVLNWLRERQVLVSWLPENRLDRATAMDLKDLPPAQAAVADWLARKYRVAPEPVAALVAEAHFLSKSSKLPAHLVLAVMAIESSFHPYIQSQAGAQGLMQVMTDIHTKRYDAFGGNMAAFDPLTNLRVGVGVLKDAIKLKGGSVEEGLKFYLGGDAVVDGSSYVSKVLAEQARLDQVAAGVKVPMQ